MRSRKAAVLSAFMVGAFATHASAQSATEETIEIVASPPAPPHLSLDRTFPASRDGQLADRVPDLGASGRSEWISGLALFGTSFTATAILGAFTLNSPARNLGFLSFVPVVGSAAWMGRGFAQDPGAAMIFMLDTLAQIAGIGLTIHGLVRAQTHWRHEAPVTRLELSMIPLATETTAGASLVGRF